MRRNRSAAGRGFCRVLACVMTAFVFLVPVFPAFPEAPSELKFDVALAPIFFQEGGANKQMLVFIVENGGKAELQGEVRATIGGQETAFPLRRIASGTGKYGVSVAEVKAPTAAKFVLRVGAQSLEKALTLKPQRRWGTVYLFHHSHTDIGYTELQTRIYKKHAEYLDSVIDYCRETDGYPEEAKFRWNIEVAWALQNYMKRRPAEKVRELLDLVKSGRVELGAWYLQLSDCFSHEGLIRSVYFAKEMSRKYGFDIRSAMNNDVTGFSWASPQVLGQAGVKYFATGINETRSRAPLRRPCAFYWESPDGSRVLHWNGEHYLFANYDLLLHEASDQSAPRLGEYLGKLEARGDYPYDTIAFNISAWVTDNCPPGRALADRVRDWNTRFTSPKLRLATMREFFEPFEKKYSATIPVHKLGWPDYWTDGVASTAYETGLNRLAHNELLTAEKLAAVAGALDPSFAYPRGEINEAYDNSMLYDEHTWGAYNSIDDPHSELARSQWTHKSGFAYEARETARTLMRKSIEHLAASIPAESEYTFLVFNPLSWKRTDIVRIDLPVPFHDKEGAFELVDGRTGEEVACQLVPKEPGKEKAVKDTLLFLAGDIPSMGYATYSLVPDKKAETVPLKTVIRGNVIENAFYKVTIDEATGGVSSLVDKETGVELVDKSSPYHLNMYIYENPVGGRRAVDNMETRARFNRSSPASAQCLPGFQGSVASSIVAKSSPRMCSALEQEIILYDGIKRIDIINRLDKQETFEPEAAYFAFPFAVEGGKFKFEIADAAMAPETEQLPGTTRDWHTVQHWVEAAGKGVRVVWSPVEAPLIQFGDINTGKWLKKLELTNPSLFSFALNNYWMTNFKASQEGKISFRYSLSSSAGGPDRVASDRFGWEVHTPLTWTRMTGKSKAPLSLPAGSFFSIDRDNVIIQAVKQAEDGSGLVLRLREIAGKPTDVQITSSLFKSPQVTLVLTDIAEGDQKSIAVPADAVVVPLKAYGIQTVKIRGLN